MVEMHVSDMGRLHQPDYMRNEIIVCSYFTSFILCNSDFDFLSMVDGGIHAIDPGSGDH